MPANAGFILHREKQMILKDMVTNQELTLSDELLWVDEYGWSPPKVNKEYSLTGALHIQTGKRKAGRPISLEPPDENTAWLNRLVVETLRQWAALPDRIFKLTFERGISRFFYVRFDHDKNMDVKPVLGAVGLNSADDPMLCKIYFYEVEAP